MYIITQNKKIVNADDIEILINDVPELGFCQILDVKENYTIVLGSYFTKEQAMKVLNEIQKIKKVDKDIVFEMPLENEVEKYVY